MLREIIYDPREILWPDHHAEVIEISGDLL
jgi:hypothetical protein